jgi:hypothetical protein
MLKDHQGYIIHNFPVDLIVKKVSKFVKQTYFSFSFNVFTVTGTLYNVFIISTSFKSVMRIRDILVRIWIRLGIRDRTLY